MCIRDSSGPASGNGAEVWYPNDSSYRHELHEEGAQLSSKILEKLTALGLTDRGIKVRDSERVDGEGPFYYPDGSIQDYYTVIEASREAGIVGIIVEHAFLSNKSDSDKLKSEAFLKELGLSLIHILCGVRASGEFPLCWHVRESLEAWHEVLHGGNHGGGNRSGHLRGRVPLRHPPCRRERCYSADSAMSSMAKRVLPAARSACDRAPLRHPWCARKRCLLGCPRGCKGVFEPRACREVVRGLGASRFGASRQ